MVGCREVLGHAAIVSECQVVGAGIGVWSAAHTHGLGPKGSLPVGVGHVADFDPAASYKALHQRHYQLVVLRMLLGRGW